MRHAVFIACLALSACASPAVDTAAPNFNETQYAVDLDECRGGNTLMAAAKGMGELIDAWRNRPRVGDHTKLPVPAPDDPSWDDYSVWRAGDLGPQDESDLNDFALADETRRDNVIRGDR